MKTQTAKDKNAGRKISKKRVQEIAFAYSFMAYTLILFAIFYVYVNVDSLIMAFQKINIDGTRTLYGIGNFKSFISKLFANNNLIGISFKNSMIMYGVGLLITLPLQIIFSYMLFKKCFAHKVIRILVLMPSIISAFVYAMVFRNFAGAELQKTMVMWGAEDFPNLLDDPRYVFGTTLFYNIWLAFSTSLIVYPNAMRSVDPAIFESAALDGICTMYQELRYIILPLIFPTLSTFLITGFAGIMTNVGCLIAFYMYSAPSQAYNMGYYLTVQIFNDPNPMRYPEVAAGGITLTLIMAPLTMLFKRFLDRIDPYED